MKIFEKAFGKTKPQNSNKRTLGDISSVLDSDYFQSFQDAMIDYSSKNLQSALSNINKTIEKADINNWQHYAFRANVYEDLSKYEEAIKNYETAISYSGDDVTVYALYHQIGFCYLSLGNNEKAAEFYTYAIELKSQHSNTEFNPDREGMNMGILLGLPFKRLYNNRANARKNIGKLNEAVEDCKRSLSYDKNYSNPYLMLSQIYSKAGQEDKAIEFLKISAQLGNRSALSTLQQLGLL